MDVTTVPDKLLACVPVGAGVGSEARIQHPGWCEAQDGIMARLAAGPAFIALLGPAGTGKSWLLQAVLAAFQAQGRAVVLVRSGELPIEAASGAILVDEAARMDGAGLARLAGVQASVVLAGLPDFEARFEQLAVPPDIVVLAPLPAQDVPGFARAWLDARGLPTDVLDARALTRLAEHSGGVPRLVTQLLRAALAMAGPAAAGIGPDEVDEVASLRLGGLRDEEAGITPAMPARDGPLDPVRAPVPAPVLAPPALVAVPGTPERVLSPDAPLPDAPLPDAPARTPVTVPATLSLVAPTRRWRKLRRAGRAAAWPAVAASLLAAVALAASQGRHPSGRGEAPAAASQSGPPPGSGFGFGSGAGAEPGGGAGQVQPLPEPHAPADEAAIQPGAGRVGAAVLEAAVTPAVPAVDPAPASVAPAEVMDMTGVPASVAQAEASATSPSPLAASWPDPAPARLEPPAAALPSDPGPAVPAVPASLAAAAPFGLVAELPAMAVPAAPVEVAAAPPPSAMQADAPADPPALVASQADPALSAPLPQPVPWPHLPPRGSSAAAIDVPWSGQRLGQPGAPGLAFVAQAGDTMPALYARVYRGVRPPPYHAVVAANAMPIRPGALVVFPTPPEGWARH